MLNEGLRRWQRERNEAHAEAVRANAEWQRENAAYIEQLHRDQAREQALRSKASANAAHAKRRAAMLKRQVPWADADAIRAIYQEARRLTEQTGIPHHVDHEIPLQGRKVSGLHVHTNLRILTGSENCRKHNRFEPC